MDTLLLSHPEEWIKFDTGWPRKPDGTFYPDEELLKFTPHDWEKSREPSRNKARKMLESRRAEIEQEKIKIEKALVVLLKTE